MTDTIVTGPRVTPGLVSAVRAYEETRRAFAWMLATGAEYRQAREAVRAAGFDPGTGLTVIPAGMMTWTDTLADGRRLLASNTRDGATWHCYSGAATAEYAPGSYVTVRSGRDA